MTTYKKMKNKYNDSELMSLMKNGNEQAKDILYEKYKYIIMNIIKEYVPDDLKNELDFNELYQEATLGFADALDKYDTYKNTNLNTFATLCIKRRLHTAIIKYTRPKEKLNRGAISIDGMAEVGQEDFGVEQEKNVTENIEVQETIQFIKEDLSDFESIVFDLMLDGYSLADISTKLEKDKKTIDNTMQRIKKKAKNRLIHLNIIENT